MVLVIPFVLDSIARLATTMHQYGEPRGRACGSKGLEVWVVRLNRYCIIWGDEIHYQKKHGANRHFVFQA